MNKSMINLIASNNEDLIPAFDLGVSERVQELTTRQYRTFVLDRINAGETVDTVFILNNGENSKVEYYCLDGSRNFKEPGEVEEKYLLATKEEFASDFEEPLLVALDFKGNFLAYKLADYDLYPPMSMPENLMELYSHSMRVLTRNFSGDRVCVSNVFNQDDPASALYPEKVTK